VLRRQVLVHRADHFFIGVRSGDLEHLRVAFEDAFRARTEAAGDDHLAVGGERFSDRIERFLDRRVDEAARVDHDEVGARVVGCDRVASPDPASATPEPA